MLRKATVQGSYQVHFQHLMVQVHDLSFASFTPNIEMKSNDKLMGKPHIGYLYTTNDSSTTHCNI